MAEAAPVDETKDGDEEVFTGPTHDPFTVKIICLAQAAQSANGLRHNDHLRYRQYCSRRLQRLYRVLRFKHGKGRYKPVPFPEDFSDPRHIEMLVVQCERAWSYGVQLKADNAAASAHNPRWRHHSIQRFAKAVKHAQHLESVCKVHADQRTQLEAEAYFALLEGTCLLEKEEWQQALVKFNRCRRVCEHLSYVSEKAESAVFKLKVQELQPMIRECRYNLGRAFDDEDDDDETGAASKPKPTAGARKDLLELSYRGHALAIPSDKIKGKLMKCLQLAGDIKVGAGDEQVESLDAYGELSAEFLDVLREIHSDMIAAGADGQSSEWRMLEAFAREVSVCMNVERNMLLLRTHFAKLAPLMEVASPEARRSYRPDEGMRFCDLLKEDVQALLELPETSDALKKTLGAYASIIANFRCLLLALCNVQLGKALEAAALLDMLQGRADEVDIGKAGAEPLARLHPLFERAQQLLPSVVGAWRCRVFAQLCTEAPGNTSGPAESGGNGRMTLDISALSAFPPRFRDIPCKPLLFDLAFPLIEPPDLQEFLPSEGKKGQSVLGRVAGGLGSAVGSRLGGLFGKK
eukprot:TRINITY_DN8696_c0_g1_i1.p1 TRINITY_DN8696_c0_g1~~TRINITY_DN8696_c0_g1_i1.p1  ORF type:complete len:600 (+),score=149.54 TRINITY_DN8696_c0_g1_i1:67-1800(+)